MARKNIKMQKKEQDSHVCEQQESLSDPFDYKTKRSINPQIDSELNRIWDFLKENKSKETELLKALEELREFDKKLDEIKNIKIEAPEIAESLEINYDNIVEQVKEKIFNSDSFNNLIAEVISKKLQNNTKVKITADETIFDALRIEFGYAKKGNVVFYNTAFRSITWHMPNTITMVTNTGFVATEDTYWIVIGE